MGVIRAFLAPTVMVVASLTCCGGAAETGVEVEPPQDGNFPNLPAGLDVIRNTTWTDYPRHQGREFDGWSANFPLPPRGYARQGTDAYGPHVELGYPDGMIDGEDPYAVLLPVLMEARQFYLGSVERWGPDDSTYDHNDIGTKLWHIAPDFYFLWVTRGGELDCTNQLHMVTEGIPIDARQLEFLPGYQSAPCLGDGYDEIQISQMPGSRGLALGDLMTFELLIDLDETTSSGRQGTIRWWIDDQLVGYGAGLADHGLNAINEFWYSGTWGGGEADGHVDGDQWRRLYRTVVAIKE